MLKILDRILTFANDLAGKYYGESASENEQSRGEFPRKRVRSDEEARYQQSLADSQGKSDFSGSGYNGPGNVDREKRHSNMSQRNY